MNPFILFLSILIIIIFSYLIIFNHDTKLSKLEYDKTSETENSYNDLELSEHGNFQKAFLNEIDSNINSADIYNNVIEINSDNENLINNLEIEENKSGLDKISNVDNIANKIYELKVMGLSNKEIAKKLGKGIREIDIISKISKSKNNYSI